LLVALAGGGAGCVLLLRLRGGWRRRPSARRRLLLAVGVALGLARPPAVPRLEPPCSDLVQAPLCSERGGGGRGAAAGARGTARARTRQEVLHGVVPPQHELARVVKEVPVRVDVQALQRAAAAAARGGGGGVSAGVGGGERRGRGVGAARDGRARAPSPRRAGTGRTAGQTSQTSPERLGESAAKACENSSVAIWKAKGRRSGTCAGRTVQGCTMAAVIARSTWNTCRGASSSTTASIPSCTTCSGVAHGLGFGSSAVRLGSGDGTLSYTVLSIRVTRISLYLVGLGRL